MKELYAYEAYATRMKPRCDIVLYVRNLLIRNCFRSPIEPIIRDSTPTIYQKPVILRKNLDRFIRKISIANLGYIDISIVKGVGIES